MEAKRSISTGQGLGIAGFVISLVGLFTSFIPIWVFFPGIIALIFSLVSLSQAKTTNSSKGFPIAGLVISLIVISIGIGHIFIGYQLVKFTKDSDKVEAFTKELQKEIEDEFTDEDMKDLEEAMEKLEGEIEDLSEESAERVGRAAGKAMKEFTKELEETAEELENDTIEK